MLCAGLSAPFPGPISGDWRGISGRVSRKAVTAAPSLPFPRQRPEEGKGREDGYGKGLLNPWFRLRLTCCASVRRTLYTTALGIRNSRAMPPTVRQHLKGTLVPFNLSLDRMAYNSRLFFSAEFTKVLSCAVFEQFIPDTPQWGNSLSECYYLLDWHSDFFFFPPNFKVKYISYNKTGLLICGIWESGIWSTAYSQ